MNGSTLDVTLRRAYQQGNDLIPAWEGVAGGSCPGSRGGNILAPLAQTVIIGSYLIAHGFFSVYGMCVDTLFLCFCE